MKIKSIGLSWFRGASDKVTLETKNKSIVVFGENGSGKSSFVDAFEYIINGSIKHLSHEYSGTHQIKAIRNTHTPEGQKSEISLGLGARGNLALEILENGKSRCNNDAILEEIRSWNYRSTVLRQDEVSQFIHGTKGEKYSTLLPLLGLDDYVNLAENLKKIRNKLEQASEFQKQTIESENRKKKCLELFHTNDESTILLQINSIHQKYVKDGSTAGDPTGLCTQAAVAVKELIQSLENALKINGIVHKIASTDISALIKSAEEGEEDVNLESESFIREKIEILELADSMSSNSGSETIDCPACGQKVDIDNFCLHIKNEQQRLNAIRQKVDQCKENFSALSDGLAVLASELNSLQSLPGNKISEAVNVSEIITGLENASQRLRNRPGMTAIEPIEGQLSDLLMVVSELVDEVSPDYQDLHDTSDKILAAQEYFEGKVSEEYLIQVQNTLGFIDELIKNTYAEIKSKTKAVVDDISTDVQDMWQVLHPDRQIRSIKLYIPNEEYKSIDICLDFHGIPQDSPRLALSEGYRNSLGLCIFLALVKKEADLERPIFLDDVIVSLDRNHRGMVAVLLEQFFADFQVLLFTHDRDWYGDLQKQLDNKRWSFVYLLPYQAPELGISFKEQQTSFSLAREDLDKRPDSAGNTARKIMDIELSMITERLGLEMPYSRGSGNDHRTAHDFIDRIVRQGKEKFFYRMDGNAQFKINEDAINQLEQADQLLTSWGNRGSHSFDVTKCEAELLIDTCEKSLEAFTCANCKNNVWSLEKRNSKWRQCDCGNLRWGKVPVSDGEVSESMN